MKKWLLVFLVCLGILISCIYLFIPNTITIQLKKSISANSIGFQRAVMDDRKWEAWWPGKHCDAPQAKTSRFCLNGYSYTILEKKLTTILLSASDNQYSFPVTMNYIGFSPDSIQLIWHAEIPAAGLPLGRIKAYYEAKRLDRDLGILIDSMSAFFANADNIYDTHIEPTHVIDTNLVSTTARTRYYPSTEQVYDLIGKLKTYIASQSAKETGFPMLNVFTTDSVNYLTRVAIPVDRKLRSSGPIEYRWMMGGANIFYTDVQGGPHAISQKFRQLENYIFDHQRISIAMPFQSLVTHRLQETDTSKWITRLYYPVM